MLRKTNNNPPSGEQQDREHPFRNRIAKRDPEKG